MQIKLFSHCTAYDKMALIYRNDLEFEKDEDDHDNDKCSTVVETSFEKQPKKQKVSNFQDTPCTQQQTLVVSPMKLVEVCKNVL